MSIPLFVEIDSPCGAATAVHLYAMDVGIRPNLAAAGALGHTNDGGERAGLCADLAAEAPAKAAVNACAASGTGLRKNRHRCGKGCQPSLRAARSKITPEDFTGSGGMGYGFKRGGMNGRDPAKPETPISHSTFV